MLVTMDSYIKNLKKGILLPDKAIEFDRFKSLEFGGIKI
jgi:glutaredoxin-related protein